MYCCEHGVRWIILWLPATWLPMGKIFHYAELDSAADVPDNTMVKWCLSLLGAQSLFFTEALYESFASGVPTWSCALYSLARLSHSSLVTICAVARLVQWLGRRKHRLFRLEQLVGNVTSLGVVLVDEEISHSCPKAQGCFLKAFMQNFLACQALLLYQSNHLLLCQAALISPWVWCEGSRACLPQHLSFCSSLDTLGDVLSAVLLFFL